MDDGRLEVAADVREAPAPEPAAPAPAPETPAPAPEPAGAGAGAAVLPLGERDLAVLALERRRYRNQGAKEQAVRDELGLSATRYYQLLNALLDDERALAHDPVLVGRLQRLRRSRTSGASR